jgi:hypothetical protein
MRGAYLFALCLLCVFFAPAFGQDAQDPYTWDFGRVSVSGGIVEHVFSLKNESGRQMNITGTYASCGCAVAEIDKQVIPPGESASLKVRFNPRGYSGRISQFAYVNTDSKENPIYKFIIKADVVKADAVNE